MADEQKQAGGVLGFLRKAAPFIGAGLSVAGPVGNLAANMLNKVLGGDPANNTPDGVMKALASVSMTPEQMVELQKVEQDFKLQMATLNLKSVTDLEKIAADDRDSARQREVSLKDKFVPILATIVIGSFITAVLAVLRGWGKVEAAFAGTLVGYLAANANQVVSYYFGSSAGSDRKTELLSQADSIK